MAADVDELVEYALLGALLRDPGQVNQMPWLTPEDFATAPGQFVYRELRRQHDQHGINPQTVPAPTADTVAERLVGMTVPAVHVSDLNRMLSLPPRGADPTSYARIVLEESIRASVRELGARIADAPAYDAVQVSAAADAATQAVHQLQQRWTRSDPPAIHPPDDAIPQPRAGAWLPDQRPQLQPIHDAERTVAAATTTAILDPAEVTAALHPEELRDPAAALAVTAISVLLADGRPVDPVTVSWQQQRLLGDRPDTALAWTELDPPTRPAVTDALDVLRADRAHELIYRAPDTLQRDADRHDRPIERVLTAADVTLTELSHAVTGSGLPRVGPAPSAPAGVATREPAGWAWLADHIDSRLAAGRDWPALAEGLDRAYADGYDVAGELPRLAARTPLPDRHPARELHYRLLDACPAAVTPIPLATRIAQDMAPTSPRVPGAVPAVIRPPAPQRRR